MKAEIFCQASMKRINPFISAPLWLVCLCAAHGSPFLQPLPPLSLPPQLSAVPCLCPPVHTRLILAWCPTQGWTGSWPARGDSEELWLSLHRSAPQPAPTPAAPWWATRPNYSSLLRFDLWFRSSPPDYPGTVEIFDELALHCPYQCSAFVILSELSCLQCLIKFHREKRL